MSVSKQFQYLIGIAAIVVIGCGVIFLSGPPELTYEGRTLDQWLRVLSTSPLPRESPLKIRFARAYALLAGRPYPPEKALTLRQVINGREPDVITFEVPLLYDLLTKHGFLETNGKLCLFVGERAVSCHNCSRASNGNCLLAWDTKDDASGLYQVHATLNLRGDKTWRTLEAEGPISFFTLTNIFGIDPYIHSTYFNGVILHAKLTDSNADYSIELQTPDGNHIKTITGSTSNGILNERWDLTDDNGKGYTNSIVNAVCHVTVPNSFSQIKTQSYKIEFQ